jgi:hypothetical protein
MADTGYNGWTNWETWNANLWICETEAAYRDLYELEAPLTEDAAMDIFLDWYPNGTPDMADTWPREMRDINFRELAEHWSEYANEA